MSEKTIKVKVAPNVNLVARVTGDPDYYPGIELMLEVNGEETTSVALVERDLGGEGMQIAYWKEMDNLSSDVDGIIKLDYAFSKYAGPSPGQENAELRPEVVDAKAERIAKAVMNLEKDVAKNGIIYESAIYLDECRENRESVMKGWDLKLAIRNALVSFFRHKAKGCIVSYYSELRGEYVTLFDFENIPGECIWVDMDMLTA